MDLPNHDEVKAESGVLGFGPKADRINSLARISYMYDIFNGLVIDARIAGVPPILSSRVLIIICCRYSD
ncbi:MAG: hypothetical protein K2X86_14550 [Cytophagaceae bacterium]|nr:hypothetical protein [Cytophagaceae bacterium]